MVHADQWSKLETGSLNCFKMASRRGHILENNFYGFDFGLILAPFWSSQNGGIFSGIVEQRGPRMGPEWFQKGSPNGGSKIDIN